MQQQQALAPIVPRQLQLQPGQGFGGGGLGGPAHTAPRNHTRLGMLGMGRPMLIKLDLDARPLIRPTSQPARDVLRYNSTRMAPSTNQPCGPVESEFGHGEGHIPVSRRMQLAACAGVPHACMRLV